jgi:RNA polymerase sigma-70 factor (ECF subfamily)
VGRETRAGDAEAFAWFFTAEYPNVVRLLTVVVHDRSAAEDLAQDAFVRLHHHWEKVSRYDNPEAWVRRVALNRAFSWRRREARRRDLERAAELRPGVAAGPDADREDVVRAVRSLPPRDRALVALYHLEDRPLAEVAEVLDLRPGAAKVALHRARRRLAELLSDREDAAPTTEGTP